MEFLYDGRHVGVSASGMFVVLEERAYASGFLTGITVMTIATVIYWCILGAGVALHSHGTFKEGGRFRSFGGCGNG
jgi:hypothetical protein